MESHLLLKDRVKHYPFLAAAFSIANISKARRRACGAVLVRTIDGVPTIICSGVNGTPAGQDNLCETHDLSLSAESVIHAEINCVKTVEGFEDESDVLYVTDSPCEYCLEYLRTTQIRTIFFARCYRLTEHLKEFPEFNFFHIPEGAVLDYMQSAITRMGQAAE